jgi:WD40 repeat protein
MKFYLREFRFIIQILIIFEIHIICGQNLNKADDSIVHILSSTGSISSLVNLPNGYLASTTYWDLIRIWNVEKGLLVRTLRSTIGTSINLAVLQNGLLVSAGWYIKGVIEFWNLNDGVMEKSIEVSYMIFSLAVLKDDMLAVVTRDFLIIVDPSTEKMFNRWPIFGIFSLAVLDDDLIATINIYEKNIEIWNIKTGVNIRNLTLNGSGNLLNMQSNINQIQYLEKYMGRKIVALDNGFLVSDKPITIWDPYKGTMVKTFNSDDSRILSLAVLKNGILASSGGDGWVKIWDIETGMEVKSFYDKNVKHLLTNMSNGYMVGADLISDEIFIWDYEKFDSNQETQLISDLSKYEFFLFNEKFT